MSKRKLTPEEAALWQRAMRRTTPLPGRAAEIPDSAIAGKAARTAPVTKTAGSPTPVRSDELESGLPGGLDAATARRLRRGQLDVDARLDLHGLHQREAHAALNEFIAHCHAAGRRRLLIITGKGRHVRRDEDAEFMNRSGDGVLRRQVPLWLAREPNRSLVFAVEPAHRRHGGAGALYVLLRRAERGSS